MADAVFQRCIHPDCEATYAVDETAFGCTRCGGLLDVAYDWDKLTPPPSLRDFEEKWSQRTNPLCFSGVWRFRELLPFAPRHPEGQCTAAVATSSGSDPGQTVKATTSPFARLAALRKGTGRDT